MSVGISGTFNSTCSSILATLILFSLSRILSISVQTCYNTLYFKNQNPPPTSTINHPILYSLLCVASSLGELSGVTDFTSSFPAFGPDSSRALVASGPLLLPLSSHILVARYLVSSWSHLADPSSEDAFFTRLLDPWNLRVLEM